MLFCTEQGPPTRGPVRCNFPTSQTTDGNIDAFSQPREPHQTSTRSGGIGAGAIPSGRCPELCLSLLTSKQVGRPSAAPTWNETARYIQADATPTRIGLHMPAEVALVGDGRERSSRRSSRIRCRCRWPSVSKCARKPRPCTIGRSVDGYFSVSRSAPANRARECRCSSDGEWRRRTTACRTPCRPRDPPDQEESL